MTDKELEQKAIKLMNLFFSFLDDSEIEKFWEKEFEVDPEVTSELTESGEYLLASIKKWLKDNVTTEVEWEGEKSRLWTPWTK
tara:strand:+ start:261 stop:509 length:249 start_codon:yes stop_codon:yes gene_type:complete